MSLQLDINTSFVCPELSFDIMYLLLDVMFFFLFLAIRMAEKDESNNHRFTRISDFLRAR